MQKGLDLRQQNETYYLWAGPDAGRFYIGPRRGNAKIVQKVFQ